MADEHPPLLPQQVHQIRRLAQAHGIVDVQLFGSRARGTSTPTSDLDLLIELGPGRDLLDMVGFRQDLEVALGCSVDVVTRRGISPYLRRRLLEEARPV